MDREFHIVDVFAESPYAGNQLAVLMLPTSIPAEADIEPRIDENLMANYVSVTDCNGEVKFAEDATAEGLDSILDADLGGTLLLASDAQDRVNDELALRKSPSERFERVTVNLLACTTAEQATVLGLEISDRVTIAIIQAGLAATGNTRSTGRDDGARTAATSTRGSTSPRSGRFPRSS